MSYSINLTNGKLLATLADGTIDITKTSLSLFGKGYAGFGQRLNENLVYLLENFANTTQPTNQLTGQLWFDTLHNQLKVYNGSVFKPVGSSTTSATPPVTADLGDTWFDTNNLQLYVYNGKSWTLIGPQAEAGSGLTSSVPLQIYDNLGIPKQILQLYVNNIVVAVISAETFTPQSSTTPPTLSGFPTINQGITLSTTLGSAVFAGSVDNANKLGGIAAVNYLRADVNETMSGTLKINNNSGLIVGTASAFNLSVSGLNSVISNSNANGNMVFTVNTAGGSTSKFQMNGPLTMNGNITVDEIDSPNSWANNGGTGTATFKMQHNFLAVNSGATNSSQIPQYSGLKIIRGSTATATEQNLYWVWDKGYADTNSGLSGSGGAWTAWRSPAGATELSSPTLVDIRANAFIGTVTTVQSADLAERYETDMPVEAGDVVILGGNKEITKSTVDLDHRVFGVVSANPGLLMNRDAGDNSTHPMIALKGRVPVKVQGSGRAGDRIVSSAVAGIARVAQLAECTAFNVVGRLIRDKYNSGTELTECTIGNN